MGQDSGNSNERLNAMKTAVKSFIDKIDENDRVDPETHQNRKKRLGNRIAVVAYSGPDNTSTTPTANNSIKLNTGWKTLGDNESITDFTGRDYLKNTAVDGLNQGGATMAHFGMQAAESLLNLDDSHKLRTVVFFTDGDPGWLTNKWGETQTVGGGWGQQGRTVLSNNGLMTWTVANETVASANRIKGYANSDKGIYSKVYSVSIISNPTQCSNVFLDQVSSNYSGASNMVSLSEYTVSDWWGDETTYYYINNWNYNSNNWTAKTGTKVADTYSFATTDTSELENVFESIAGDSGGGSEDLGEQAVTEVDVVSASFMMPPGTNKSDIRVYLEECYDTAEKEYIDEDDLTTKTGEFLQFRNRRGPILPPNTLSGYTYDNDGDPETAEVAADRNIKVEFAKSGTDPNNPDKEDMIVVNGYDYGGNWCGPRYDTDGTTLLGYHGYKLVVVIPIMMDTNAVGGPDVSTNADGSGIKVNGNNVASFRSPQVSLPINIHIRKEGLDVGESAKFTIQRKYVKDSDAPAGTTNNWVDVSSVFVTRHQGQEETGKNAPVTKIMGMPSVDDNDKAFVYRVVEDNWNWSGRLVSIKDYSDRTIGNVATRSATTDEIEINPFIFVNEEINNIDVNVRHAESKATNIFKTGETLNPGYDDSKNNNRDVIVVSNSSSNQP